MDHLSAGQNVLVIWKTTGDSTELQNQVEKLKSKVEPGGKISLENVDRLVQSQHGASTFDVILSGVLTPHSVTHDTTLLEEIIRVLKPNGHFVLQEVADSAASAQLEKNIILSGFTKPTAVENKGPVVEITCQKPNFEVGSSVPLNLKGGKKAAVWKLDDNVEEDLLDPDTLLDDEDKKKPDPASLRVCGTTGKRKACKDCSCGLADELAAGDAPPAAATQPKASSCGSCYLGDAFRCATCPYLGMPAFKPGEKIMLTDNQLKADV